MDLSRLLERIFERHNRQLGWSWIAPERVLDENGAPRADAEPFRADEDYVVLRVSEMYLRATRVLWREYYPVVHAYIAYGATASQRSVSTVAGPAQLKDLGTANLDRLIGLAYRLAGPIVYDGQDIEILLGLYAVPANDGAKVLVDTLSQLTAVVPALQQASQVANVLKTGAENLIGLDGTRLALGVHDALRSPGAGAGTPARPGFIVAVNAPAADVDRDALYVTAGRLQVADETGKLRPYEGHDYMLVEIHRGPSQLPVWATLPDLSPFVDEFDELLQRTEGDVLKRRVNEAFHRFEAALRRANLTSGDRSALRAVVAADLKRRVDEVSGGIFESMLGQADAGPRRRFRVADLPMPEGSEPLPTRPEGLDIVP